MSNSSDSLKKKVCVTVFLDELFEEVEEEEDRRELRQVSDVAESVAKTAEKPIKEPSRVDLGNDEKVTVCPTAETEQSQVQLRPRKHRRESKFSENLNDSLKDEFNKYEHGSSVNVEGENGELPDSAVSDSDFDMDEFLGLSTWTVEESKSTLSGFSDGELTDETFPSIHPGFSSTVASCLNIKIDQDEPETFFESCVSYSNKSTQFETTEQDGKTTVAEKVALGSELPKEEEEVLAWKKTHRQIQLILAEAKGKYQEKEACEGDRIRHYDLRSILEECVRKEGRLSNKSVQPHSTASSECNVSDAQEPSDSYTCVFPHSKQGLPPPEVKRVWANAKRSIWNDGFDSDLSEDCGHYAKDVALLSLKNDSLLCYSVCLKCNEGEQSGQAEIEKELTKKSSSWQPVDSSRTSLKSMKLSAEPELVFQAVAHLGDRILGKIMKAEPESKSGSQSEGCLSQDRMPSEAEGRSKNFAEGDTITKPLSHESTLILNLETNEKLFVCDEILKRVGDPKVLCSEIIVNRAEIGLHAQSGRLQETGTQNTLSDVTTASDTIAEVFFNQKTESLEKTDVESEMVFAESESFWENEDFCSSYPDNRAPSLPKHPEKDVCVLEFEEKLSRSKILRRMKTVEILGDSSLNDMKNISTEVILICENISNKELSMEAWHGSAPVLKNINDMKQCYLKDSRDSTMYLIEVPLRFTKAKKEKPSESTNFYEISESN